MLLIALAVLEALPKLMLLLMGCRLCQNPKTVDVMKWSWSRRHKGRPYNSRPYNRVDVIKVDVLPFVLKRVDYETESTL